MSRYTKPFPAEAVELLGAVGDFEIAFEFGISQKRVRAERRSRGIEPFHLSPYRENYPLEMIALLGKISDRAIAQTFGVAKRTAFRLRKKLNISAIKRGRPKSVRAEARKRKAAEEKKIDELASEHEESCFEDEGHAAFGLED